jgi:uncharacterized protein (TIGR02145 family)
MKTIITLKRPYRFKASMAFLTCLMFLILPSCQEDEFNQASISDMSPYASSKRDKPITKVKDVDGNWYHPVTIGTQIWMIENLKTTKYNDRTSIPNIEGNSDWLGTTSGAYCWYNNDINYKNPYGALYNLYAVTTGKLCPTGWHVPTDLDWKILETYLGMIPYDVDREGQRGVNNEGGRLKEAGLTHWSEYNVGATNETGFTALPGGYRWYDGTFCCLWGYGYWWTSTVGNTPPYLWSRGLCYDASFITRGCSYFIMAASVRCIKD